MLVSYEVLYHIGDMDLAAQSQQNRAIAVLNEKGMVRLSELREAGVTATTVSRMLEKGLIAQLGRGLYQLADAQLDVNHSLAEAVKLAPKGVICLTSALAYHDLTDTIPPHVWMAIGSKDWRPRIASLKI